MPNEDPSVFVKELEEGFWDEEVFRRALHLGIIRPDHAAKIQPLIAEADAAFAHLRSTRLGTPDRHDAEARLAKAQISLVDAIRNLKTDDST